MRSLLSQTRTTSLARRCLIGLALAGVPCLVLAAAVQPAAGPLSRLGWHVTTGAAPGYVDSRTCRTCHLQIWESYQDVGMAKSFFRPDPARNIEDFEHASFEHDESGDRYTMRWRDGRLWFHQEQLGDDGRPVFDLDLPVDWILGSGHHSRSYLYRSGGELYQLPVSWYTDEQRWGMSPGYEKAAHPGVLREVRRECMACHNAFPDVPAGSDSYALPPTYPEDLPEGTGCQRCHGPGAAHVDLALDPKSSREAIRASVVNPARLAPALRNDVCAQCHLQPSAALSSPRRFGQGDYAYRPGTPLASHIVQIEAEEQALDGKPAAETRFEINHHAYRLRRSRCFLASAARQVGGAPDTTGQGAPAPLECITCHDPHRRVAPSDRVAHFRQACLTCHTETSCSRKRAPDAAALAYSPADAADDCVTCHMPKRRPADVVHVVVTDHLIQRRPPDGLLAMRTERDPVLLDARLLEPETIASPAEAELYRVVAALRTRPSAAGVDRLAALLSTMPTAPREARLDLALAQMQQHRFPAAEITLRGLQSEGARLAQDWLAIAESGQGDTAAAIETLRHAANGPDERAESRYNRGRLLLATQRFEEARAELLRAVELRPNLAAAWQHLGECELRLGHPDGAAIDARHALGLDPQLTDAYLTLGEALVQSGQRGEALRVLRHGAEHATDAERVRARLARVGETP